MGKSSSIGALNSGDWPLLCIRAMLGLFHRPFLLNQQLASCQELNGQRISLNEWSSIGIYSALTKGRQDNAEL